MRLALEELPLARARLSANHLSSCHWTRLWHQDEELRSRRMWRSHSTDLFHHRRLHQPICLQSAEARRCLRMQNSRGCSCAWGNTFNNDDAMRRCVTSSSRLTALCGGQREQAKSRHGLVARLSNPKRMFMPRCLALQLAALPQKDFHIFWRVLAQHARMLPFAWSL